MAPDFRPNLRVRITDPEGRVRIQAFPGGQVVCGRDSAATLTIEHPSVSRQHCLLIEKPDGGLLVRDLKSTWGTLLNGEAVTEASLRPGDIITLGEIELVVEEDSIPPQSPSPPPPPFPSPLSPPSPLPSPVSRLDVVHSFAPPDPNCPFPEETEREPEDIDRWTLDRLRTAYRKQHQAFRTLLSISTLTAGLTRGRPGQEFFDRVIESLRSAFPMADNVAVLTRTPPESDEKNITEGGMMPLLEVAAQEFYVAPEGSTAAPSRAVIQTMVSSRRALYVWDAQKDPRLTDSDSTHIRGLRSVMCVPFLINDQVRGALYVESVRQPYSFDRQDLELLAVFAHHVATALDNGRLYEVLDQAAERCLAEAQSARYDKAALTLAVRQSEKKFRALFEQSTLGTVLINARTGLMEEANDGLANLLGVPRRELTGRPFRDLFPYPESVAVGDWLRLVLQRGEAQAETHLRHTSGQLVSVYHKARSLKFGAEELVLSNFLDISARKRAENELQTQLRRITTLQEVSQAFMSTLDLNRLYRLIYDKVRSVIPTDAFLIAILSRGGDTLRPVFAVDIIEGTPQIVPSRESIPATAPFYKRLLEDRHPYLELRAPDQTPASHYSPFGNVQLRSASLLFVPMIAGDTVVGMMTVQSYTRNAYEDSHLDLLLSIATLAAMAFQNAQLYDSIRRHREDLQQLSNQILEAQELERGRIARELHDGIGQLLTGLKLNLESLQGNIPESQETARARLADAVQLSAQAIEDLRGISLDLRPSMLDDLGLLPTLDWLCVEVTRRHGIQVQFSADLGDAQIPDATESAIYRIVQEGLANIVKHAKARGARVELTRADNAIHLSILDDGCGFDMNEPPARHPRGSGSGLLNMKERAAMLGGTFRVSSTPGEGTLLSLKIPLGE